MLQGNRVRKCNYYVRNNGEMMTVKKSYKNANTVVKQQECLSSYVSNLGPPGTKVH